MSHRNNLVSRGLSGLAKVVPLTATLAVPAALETLLPVAASAARLAGGM